MTLERVPVVATRSEASEKTGSKRHCQGGECRYRGAGSHAGLATQRGTRGSGCRRPARFGSGAAGIDNGHVSSIKNVFDEGHRRGGAHAVDVRRREGERAAGPGGNRRHGSLS